MSPAGFRFLSSENATYLLGNFQIDRVPALADPPDDGDLAANPWTSRVTPSGNDIDLTAIGHKIGKAGKM